MVGELIKKAPAFRFDRDFKNVFHQETNKVIEIANDIKVKGFDKTRPIILTETYTIVDGHSRFSMF